MLLHKHISMGKGQLNSQLNKKWEKIMACHNDNDSLLVHPSLQEQGRKGASLLQDVQARASGYPARRAWLCRL